MDAYDFTREISDREEDFRFGVSNDNAAKALRKLADDLDKGKIVLQASNVRTVAHENEFTQTILRLTFSEKRVKITGGNIPKNLPESIEELLPKFDDPSDFRDVMHYGDAKQEIMGVKKLHFS